MGQISLVFAKILSTTLIFKTTTKKPQQLKKKNNKKAFKNPQNKIEKFAILTKTRIYSSIPNMIEIGLKINKNHVYSTFMTAPNRI